MPLQFTSMINYGLKGDNKQAYEVFYKLTHGIDLIFEEGNPAGIKAMLNEYIPSLNIDARLPLVKVSKELNKKIINFVKNLK